MISVIKFLVFILLIHLNDAIYSIPSKVPTQIGGSYTLMIFDDNITPEECYATDVSGNITYSINLKSYGLPLVQMNTRIHRKRSKFQTKAKDTNEMTTLGNGICGFKLDNVGKNYVSSWNMSFIDKNGDSYSTKVSVYTEAVLPRVETQYTPVGSSISINCADSMIDRVKSLNFCQLYNPQQELVKMDRESCYYSKDLSTVSDYGRWKCVLNYESNMVETEVYFDVFEKDINIINTWTNETSTHVNIGCSITNSSTAMFGDSNFCLMIRPDGKQFTLRAGLANPRYTSIHMNMTNGVCAMEIEKPLETIEKGLWRCEAHNQAGYNDIRYSPIGGFINLSDKPRSLPPPVIPKEIFAHINESFTASCRVPYSSSSCYMRGPDGTIYPVEDNRGPTLGLCKFTKEEAALADNGTWFCAFAKKTGEPDAVYSFNVFLPEIVAVKPESEAIETRSASTITLKCSTQGLGDYPIQYCQFLSPSGQMYTINPKNDSDRMSYSGRGFKYGDCGIELKDISKEDEGIWSCITRIGHYYDQPEVYSNIHLAVNDNLSVASVLGIFIGVGVVCAGVIIFVAYKFRRNRGGNNRFLNPFRRNATARSSNSSSSSNNSTAVFNVTETNNDRNYQATDDNVIRSRSNVINDTDL